MCINIQRACDHLVTESSQDMLLHPPYSIKCLWYHPEQEVISLLLDKGLLGYQMKCRMPSYI